MEVAKKLRRKHTFIESEGQAINPYTEKKFEIGDEYEGMVFQGYKYRTLVNGSKSKYIRLVSKNRWDKIIKMRGRNLDNPNLIKTVVDGLLEGAKKRSKKRNQPAPKLNRISISNALQLGWCQETYPPLPLKLDQPGSPFSPSIDRIDSSKGYADDNIRISCRQVNISRNNFSDEDTILTCQRLASFLIRRREKRSNSI